MASELYGQRVSEAGVKHTAHLEDRHSHAEGTSFRQGGGKQVFCSGNLWKSIRQEVLLLLLLLSLLMMLSVPVFFLFRI